MDRLTLREHVWVLLVGGLGQSEPLDRCTRPCRGDLYRHLNGLATWDTLIELDSQPRAIWLHAWEQIP